MSPNSESPRIVRVALLICGRLTGPVHAVSGSYYDVYSRFLTNSLPPNSNTEVVVDGFDVTEMEYPEDNNIPGYDMIMLTGAAASAYEDIPWINHLVAWIQHVTEDYPKVKICGICFGHQIVGRALGGKCVRNNGHWEVGPTKVQMTDIGKSLFGVDEIGIQQMHRDHIPLDSLSDSLSSGKIHLIGSTGIAGNQGLVKFHPSLSSSNTKSLEQIHIITLQGHPEFTESIVTRLVRQRSASGAIDAGTTRDYFGIEGDSGDVEPPRKEGTGRRWWKNDGVDIVGRTFWKMFGVGSG